MPQFSNSVELGVLSPFFERQAQVSAAFDPAKFPNDFPSGQWSQQSLRYAELMRWYAGDALAETRQDKNGDTLSQYPLHMNTIRAFVRKHSAVLFGEVADGAAPLVKTVVRPRKRFDGQPVKEEDKKLAETCEAVINEVWTRSYGRAMMLENGKYSQFLGGSVFDIDYEPQRRDLMIPLVIRNPRPDYFLPEWKDGDYWSLLRASTIYSMPAPTAKLQYNIGKGEQGQKAIYTKIRTADKYSVKIDGVPIPRLDKKLQDDLDNPFEVTPSIYIPHMREGANYGPTHIEDVASLLKEYNGRIADLGDAVLQTTTRPIWGSNIQGEIKDVVTSDGIVVKNLGYTPAASGNKDSPKIMEGTPPPVSQYMIEYANMIWRQMLRECDLSGIPFGEDEGSQRSGQTLALRMWPLLSHTREERTHWNDGLTKAGYILIKMVRKINELNKGSMASLGIDIPEDFDKRVEISVEWAPQIPQDRTALVAETRDLKAGGLRSLHEGLVKLGDVKDIDAEEVLIKADQKLAADLASQQNQPFGGAKPTGNGTTSNGSTAAASSTKSSAN